MGHSNSTIMQDSHRKLSGLNSAEKIFDFIFFALFCLYLWLVVDLRLIYHGAGLIRDFPSFFRGWTFSEKFISYPGGPIEYISAFLSQFFYYSWSGSLTVTLQAWLICACADAFIKAIGLSLFRNIRFIPPILLLIIYTQYIPYFVITMGLLTAMFFACLYLKTIQ